MIRLVAALFLGEPARASSDRRGAAHTARPAGPAGRRHPRPVILPEAADGAGLGGDRSAFASTLVWEGMSLETIYGYWNPMPIAIVAVAAALLLGLFLRLVRPLRPACRRSASARVVRDPARFQSADAPRRRRLLAEASRTAPLPPRTWCGGCIPATAKPMRCTPWPTSWSSMSRAPGSSGYGSAAERSGEDGCCQTAQWGGMTGSMA